MTIHTEKTILSGLRFVFVVASIIFLTPNDAHSDSGAPKALTTPVPASPALEGMLSCIGSDTINNLMTLWGEQFRKMHPKVVIQVEGKGSGTAPPALIQGTAQLGPMSREWKNSELELFEKSFGFKPTGIKVAVDALGIFVNKDNPLSQISLEQIDAIFSKTRRRGGTSDITTWGQLGLSGSWASKRISIYGRNSASGTYGYFKQRALDEGDFKDIVKEQPGSSAVVQSVSVDSYSIGYSGIGYKTSGVKALSIAEDSEAAGVAPIPENAYNGSYPLSRFLYIYFKKDPHTSLDPLVAEFLKFVLSAEGQQLAAKDGYFPLTEIQVAEERAKIE